MSKILSRLAFSLLIILSITACSTSQGNENNDETDDTARVLHSDETPPEVTTTSVRIGDFSRELVSNGKL